MNWIVFIFFRLVVRDMIIITNKTDDNITLINIVISLGQEKKEKIVEEEENNHYHY